MKSDAEIIREELVAISDERIKLFSCSMTLLAALEMALHYIRRDLREQLGVQTLPLPRFLVGTFILCAVAIAFSSLMLGIGRRTTFLRDQYEERCPNALELPPRNQKAKWLVLLCFFMFPLFDIGIRLLISIKIL
jgi:hypothetical protein